MRLFVTSCLLVAAIGWETCPPNLAADDRPGGFALPIATLTPGAVSTATTADLCARGMTKGEAPILPDVASQVWQRYNFDQPRDAYIIDWLVPAGLGGEGAIPNLWPQLTKGPWNHADKLKLEAKLRDLVCATKLALPTAQRALTDNWTTAYEKYVGKYP